MIRRPALLLVLGAAVTLTAALAHGSPPARPLGASLVRYRDPAGWWLTYPSTFHLEQSRTRPGIGLYEVTIASFRSARGVRSWSWPGGGRTDLAPPAKPFPANGVAFRIWWNTEAPGFLGAEAPDSRFPLRLADFTQPAPFLSVRPGRALQITADGESVGGIIWVGRRASPSLRATLARVVASLRFPPEHPGTLIGDGSEVLEAASRYPPGSFTLLPGPGLLCGGSPSTCTRDVVPLFLVHAGWPLHSPWRFPCRSQACVPIGSFYAVEWWHINGYASRCQLRADARRRAFYCANLHARWDRFGRALSRPRWAPVSRNLTIHPAKVSWDGYVVVSTGASMTAPASGL